MEREKQTDQTANSSIRVGGNVTGSSLVSGHYNTVTTTYTKTTLPPAESVDIKGEMAALKRLLRELNTEDGPVIDGALTEAEHHLKKANPDKDKVGGAVQRALEYAKAAGDFADKAAKLAPVVRGVSGWLGGNWHTLLGYVGLAL